MSVIKAVRIKSLAGLIAGLALSSLALADLPVSGMSRQAVTEQYGEPEDTTLPVGHPPITRWTYDDFNVVFEYDHVIHAYRRIKHLEERNASQMPKRPGIINLVNRPAH